MKIKARAAFVFGVWSAFLSPAFLGAEEAPDKMNTTLDLNPARYSFVKGDAGKFEAHHWIKTGYAGGVDEFKLEDSLPGDTSLRMEARGIFDEHDVTGSLKLKKDDWAFLNAEYKEFEKFYDTTGGFYRPFSQFNSVDIDKDLRLDIKKIEIETGVLLENLPDITLVYEGEFKKGAKSRLTWASVTEGAVARKTAPSFQEIDEEAHRLEIKADDKLFDFDWTASQAWETVRSRTMREEKQFSDTTAASNVDQKIRDQFQEPRSDAMTSLLGLQRWFSRDKFFVSGNYRFAQINTRELENIFEVDQNRVLTNFSGAEQVRDAHADNLLTSHTWVGSLFTSLFQPLTLAAKLKMETFHRTSASTYPKDNQPQNNNGTQKPNGTIDQIDVSENQEKATSYGEGVSLRYNGIPRVALYNEYEFQQTRNNLYEDRQSVTAAEVFNRQVITHVFRGVGTLGAQIMPSDILTLTLQGRHREDDIRYNNVRYTNNNASGAKSVFVDGQFIRTDEASARAAFKLHKWFRPAFRYQLQNKQYSTWGLPNSDVKEQADMISNVYTADVASQLLDNFLTTVSFSYRDEKTFTPARFGPYAASIPSYNGDVYTWLACSVYELTSDLSLSTTLQHTWADNFQDLGGQEMTYYADFESTDLTLGCRWNPKKDLSVEPKYSFYQYRANPDSESGNYNAHVLWLEVRFAW